jgi:hypothetical protein
MKNLTLILAISGLLLLSQSLYSQSYVETFQNATFLLEDGSTHSASINAKQLLTRNVLQFEKAQSTDWELKNISTVTIDSTTYHVRELENISDTVKVMEKVIDGKISLYRSPRISTNEQIFAEKDKKVYELRIIKRLVHDTWVYVNEYSSTLQFLVLDCKEIDRDKVGSNVGLGLGAISKIVTKYNGSCGWQKTLSARKAIKPEVTFGITGGALMVRNDLSYANKRMIGKNSLTGFYAGPSLAVGFRKFYDTRLTFDLLFEKLSGEGNAYSRGTSSPTQHVHNYDIFQLKNILAFNYILYRDATTTLYFGIGTVFQIQLVNNTTWQRVGSRTEPSESLQSRKDGFNMAPVGHLHLKRNRVGFRYQVVALSIQMKTIEQYALEHRVSVHYDLRKTK